MNMMEMMTGVLELTVSNLVNAIYLHNLHVLVLISSEKNYCFLVIYY